ncbi:leucine--tRNA ligase [Ruminococcaceae bacterium OttesenSCG-928-D13]|nr:leucine--tRNA ligase [Ruminococcaceae bacterium OttesenSCG-928-D13]
MTERYDPKTIEPKWQKVWLEEKTFSVREDPAKKKFYALVEFPYPSAQGLHVGHPRPYTAMDVVVRKRRMQGENVLYPMGWDAFGLPTENFAIKNHIHPAIVTKNNIDRFRSQIQALGISFDWDREVNTTDPAYYKWTQWIFLQLYKKGLAYKKEMSVNWCTGCKVVLANEEVVNGACERCGSDVVRKEKSQWMLKITEYAGRLIDDLEGLDYIERVATSQVNWIGRSHGAEITFGTTAGDEMVVYTTRPDTVFGATYMVMSPEHPYLKKWAGQLKNLDAVAAYQDEAAHKSDFERTELSKDKEKTGVRLEGVAAINPATEQEIPIYISDYVLASYGTGAIMAVPGHDERDYAFAKKFGLPIVEVVAGGDIEKEAFTDCETGVMVNSGFLDGLSVDEAKKEITDWLVRKGKGEAKTNYKLRDWVFSRQRYWGEPIPMVWCDSCGWQPISEDQLPLELPYIEDFEPTAEGDSPLARHDEWVNTTCPKCGGPGKRETDTMPQWAGSSWYFLRYCDPDNAKAIADLEKLAYWMPVDWYNGGMEHTTLHMLYSRFWHKFLFDIGVVKTKEPYMKRTSHGMILGEDGQKMSKSRGNVVNPDDVISEFGADTMRVYEMFIGDFEKTAPWNTASIKGSRRFLDRVWALQDSVSSEKGVRPQLEAPVHRTIKKVTNDVEHLKHNTAIAALMSLLNDFVAAGGPTKDEYKVLIHLLNPFAPHISEELWQRMGYGGQVAAAKWPEWDEAKTVEDTIEIVVQVNGKPRGHITAAADIGKEEALAMAKADEGIQKQLADKQIVKEIWVPGKLINFAVKG